MGADHGVEVVTEPRTPEFDLDRLAVGVGDQHQAPARGAHCVQEVEHVWMHRDQVVHLLLELRDVEAELARPVVHTVPVERALGFFVARHQLGLRGLEGERVFLGVAPRHVLQPEVVVVVQVEQRAVHVEQHGVDFFPGNHGVGG